MTLTTYVNFKGTCAEAFQFYAEQLGGKVTKDFTYSLGDSDFSSQVNEIASMDPKPEVLYTAMIMPLILNEPLEQAAPMSPFG